MAERETIAPVNDDGVEEANGRKAVPPKKKFAATFQRVVGSKLTSAVKGTHHKAGAITRGTTQRVTTAFQQMKDGVNKTKKKEPSESDALDSLKDPISENEAQSADECVMMDASKEENPSVETNDGVVTLGPFLEFITADTTLLCIFTLAAAIYPTFEYWDPLFHPTSAVVAPAVLLTKVGLPWMAVAFTLGLALGQYMEDLRWISPLQNLFTKGTARPSTTDGAAHLEDATSEESPETIPHGSVRTPDAVVVAKHSVFISLLGKKRSEHIQFRRPPAITIPPKVKAWTTLRTTTEVSTTSPESARSFRLPWQRNISPTDDGFLMQHLLKHSSFRRTRCVVSDAAGDLIVEEVATEESTHLGTFDLSSTAADSLEGFVVEPIFKLRGMDVFLTDDPEAQASTHPWLIEQGLRSVPTFIVNVLTQWGNILIYFEMPAWVRGFQHTEEETDPDDVKALKRFLNGNADYRNARLKMIPSLVDGPMPIRMVAPPKREKVVNCDWMPILWNQRDEEPASATGHRMCAQLEATLDCMTSRAIRSMAGLVKRYLHILSIDVAVVIAKPDGAEDDEPSACLGLWRFNHIDVSECPHLPDRCAVEARSPPEADVLRVSRAIGALSAEGLEELTAYG